MNFPIKNNTDPFESLGEFIDNLKRGGEIEFVVENKKYSITHPNGILSFVECDNNCSETTFNNVEDLLEHKINGKKLCDIVTQIQPFFRCF